MSKAQLTTDTLFKTWKHSGVVYIAVRNGAGFHICNERGEFFGGFVDYENFRSSQREGDPFDQIGKVNEISFRTVAHE